MKTQNPLIGRSRKSYGDATFYTLNGQNIVRTKPMVVSNPNTPAQQAQRIRFKAFTAAANSMSEVDLNLLFATKTIGRNRRSMLQAQLAPAYGVQATTDPQAAEKYEPTFDITKISEIGSGSIGYQGDFIECTQGTPTMLAFEKAKLLQMVNNMVDYKETNTLLIVAISKDGCIIKVLDTNKTIAQVREMAVDDNVEIADTEFSKHGNLVNCYALAGDRVYLQGFGSFIIKKGKQKTGRDMHNVPV